MQIIPRWSLATRKCTISWIGGPTRSRVQINHRLCYKSRRMGRGRRYNPLMSGPLLLGETCPERTAEPIITEGGQRCCWCETGFTPPFQITSRHPYCFTATIGRVSAFVNGVPNSGTYFRYD